MAAGEENLLKTYNRFPVVFEHGEGMYLYDVEEKKYLDFGAGIAVNSLGYGNEAYTNALKDQIDKLTHISNLYYNVPLVEASEKVIKASGLSKVFFTNSGTEAIEGALKLAKKYAYLKKPRDDYEFIAMNHSFHGRSMGALSVTGNAHYQEGFLHPDMTAVFADFNDIDSVKAAITEKTCGIILEPIQGEGGIYPATEAFMKELRAICDEKDIVLIFDEIQCGMGRSGYMFAHEMYHVKPDVLTLAKALGCGVPVGAFVVSDKVKDALKPGEHGTTYGGNPFACAAVSKVFDLYEEMDLVSHVKETGVYLYEKLESLKETCSSIVDHRGVGFMQGLEFNCPAGEIVKKALEKGLLLIGAGANVIRFVPPLITKKEDVDTMVNILKEIIL